MPEPNTSQADEPMTDTAATDATAHPARLRTLAILTGLVTLPIVILDQVTKLYVSAHMALYQSIVLIPHCLEITYTQNPGAAFSLFATLPAFFRTGFLFSLSAVAIIVLLYLMAGARRVTLMSFSFAMILGGAVGNLIDRAVRGRVIDFIHVHYYAWNYPVFNVADSAITVGVTMVFLSSFLSRRHERRVDDAGV